MDNRQYEWIIDFKEMAYDNAIEYLGPLRTLKKMEGRIMFYQRMRIVMVDFFQYGGNLGDPGLKLEMR